jgi:hypothetical protein
MMAVKDVGPDFAAFLSREMSCGASGCKWQWFIEDPGNARGFFVGCASCNSSYPPRDTHYLQRICGLERAISGDEEAA